MTTSASFASRRTIPCPSAVRRLTVTDFLFRFCTCHHSEVPWWTFLQLRRGSPSGGSILMTSAPNSAKNFPAKGPAIDRKSTRLNSSHITISYAVFCLKKKKKKKKKKNKYHITKKERE